MALGFKEGRGRDHTVEVAGTLLNDGAKSLKAQFPGFANPIFLPTSQVEHHDGVFYMPAWLAKKEGLAS